MTVLQHQAKKSIVASVYASTQGCLLCSCEMAERGCLWQALMSCRQNLWPRPLGGAKRKQRWLVLGRPRFMTCTMCRLVFLICSFQVRSMWTFLEINMVWKCGRIWLNDECIVSFMYCYSELIFWFPKCMPIWFMYRWV